MADVRPFRAITFTHTQGEDVSSKTAPPYDVISQRQRETLVARDPHNVVALELPEGPLDPSLPGSRYETGAARWDEWREANVLAQDDRPTIYVLEQRYELGGAPIRRRAFIAAVRLEPFSAGVVLPHERTLPKALDDRLNMLRATGVNLSQVLGLFSDPEQRTDAVFERACAQEPTMRATGDDGVESVLWSVTDDDAIATLAGALADERIFIADGHHRYTTALSYRDERRASTRSDASDDGPDSPAYDFVAMALVNMDDPDLVVLPTHRVADAPGDFDEVTFWNALTERFDVIEPLGDAVAVLEKTGADRQAFLVRTASRTSIARLREDVDVREAIPGAMSDAWKSLDVAVLQELILDPLLGIHPDRAETLERLSFVKDANEALAAVDEHDVVFVMNATRMEQLRDVALAGEIMPQKSTYFFPKLLSGLVFRSAR